MIGRIFFSGCIVALLHCISSCDNEVKPFDCTTSDLSLHLDGVTMASGCNVLDGGLQVTATGGKEPFSFSIDEVVQQTSGIFTDIQAGIYRVTVTDANGCQASVNNVNVPAEGFSVSTDVQPDNVCVGGDGSVTVNVSGGEEPFLYRIGTAEFGSDNVFTGLDKGDHKITVKDNSDCTVQLTITVPHGFTGVSWATQILPIIQARCVDSGCHDGVYRPDLRKYDRAKFYSTSIKKLTQDGSMPFDGAPLTQQQIDLIACWVDDGAFNN